jgi:hypothetical protein
MKDVIVEEVRKYRHEHEMQFGLDLDALFEDVRKHQADAAVERVRLPPKRLKGSRRWGASAQVAESAAKYTAKKR